MLDHPGQFLHALLVGGHLGAQVGGVLARVARRPAPGGEHLGDLGLPEPALGDQMEVVDKHPFLADELAKYEMPDDGSMSSIPWINDRER